MMKDDEVKQHEECSACLCFEGMPRDGEGDENSNESLLGLAGIGIAHRRKLPETHEGRSCLGYGLLP